MLAAEVQPLSQLGLEQFAPSPPKPKDGWDLFTRQDLKTILYGDQDLKLTGYFNRSRSLDLRKLGLPLGWLHGEQETLENIGLQGPGLGRRFLVAHCDSYQEYCKKRRICLFADDGSAGRWLFMPYTYRGSADYQKGVAIKIRKASEKWPLSNKGSRVRGVELRISIRGRGSPLLPFLQLKNYLNSFLMWLWKARGYRRRNPENGRMKLFPRKCSYMWSIEPTKRGYAHFHIMFATKYLIKVKKIVKWWMKQGLDIETTGIHIDKIRSDVIGYMMKYITKTHESGEWNSLLSLTRKRSWGT